ncbi:MAG TPA: metal-dependent hydrolase [Longimicrobiaceae bacterium]|nr:metal-dependent hydrolase [Longimicrobiaceae bacterium]
MAFPPAHLLVGAGVGELVRGPARLPHWQAWAAGAGFAVLPDADTMLRFALGVSAPDHGVYTHSLVSVMVVAICTWVFLGPRWALVAAVAYISHLMVDLLREGSTSVRLLWPFLDEPAQGLYPLFPTIPFEAGEGLGGAAPTLYGPSPLRRVVEQTLIGAAVFLGALSFTAIRRRAGRPAR